MKQGWTLIFAILIFVFGTSAIVAANVKTDYNHQFDFSQVHTYSWGQVTTSNPLYVQRIKNEVNRDLQAKGWQLVTSGGSVVIFAKGRVHNQQELETYYNGLGGGWGRGWGWRGWEGGGFGEATTTTTNQPVGMLVIDIFSSISKDLLWRGASQENLSRKSEKNTRNLDKDIDKMFDKFPPSKG